eukprot:13229655-Alexandrium_andersonii.AAC.1
MAPPLSVAARGVAALVRSCVVPPRHSPHRPVCPQQTFPPHRARSASQGSAGWPPTPGSTPPPACQAH